MVDFQRAEATEIRDDALVQNQITGLLASDSPYMQQATTRGNQEAQGRGLLSSSIAAGAVEDSRISAALPIAQQDAQTFANADLQDSAYNQQVSLNDQGFNQQLGLNDQVFGHNTQLADQAFGHNQQLAEDQFGYNTQLNNQTFGHQQELNDQTFGHQAQLNQNQFQYDQQLNSQNNAAQASLQQSNQAAEIQLNTNQQIAAIEQNPNMSAAQQQSAISNLINLSNASIQSIQTGQQLANTEFTFSNAGSTSASYGGQNLPEHAIGTTSNGQLIYQGSSSNPRQPPFAAPNGKRWTEQAPGTWMLTVS